MEMHLIVIPRSWLWRKARKSEFAHLWEMNFVFDVSHEASIGLHNGEGVGMRILFHIICPFGHVC